MSYVAGVAQVGIVMLGAPLVIGVMRQVRARAEGRAGGGVLQPWRDLRKQLGKQSIRPHGTTRRVHRGTGGRRRKRSADRRHHPHRGDRVTARRGRRSVRGRRSAVPRHGCAGAGRDRHRHIIRRHGRQPGDHHRRARRTDDPAGRLRPLDPGRIRESRRPGGQYDASPRPGGVAGRSAGLRRPGDRDHRRDRPPAGGQPRHPSGADDGARGDGPRVRRPPPGARRVGGRDAPDGSAGVAGKPVRAVGNCRRITLGR